MARLGLVRNDSAGSGRAAAVPRLLAALGAEVVELSADGEGTDAAALDRVVVAGGDGSLGPAADLAARLGLPLAVVPVGTANDFARALGVPARLEDACRLAVRGRALAAVDLGRLGSRPFLNSAVAGVGAAASREAHRLKPRLGVLAYAAGAVKAAVVARPLAVRVECDGEERFRGRAWQVLAACSGAFGGGASVAGAHPADGRLHVTVLAAGSRLHLAAYGYALRRGRPASLPGGASCRARLVRLELPAGRGLSVDGEPVRAGDPLLELRVEQRALRVVVPGREEGEG